MECKQIDAAYIYISTTMHMTIMQGVPTQGRIGGRDGQEDMLHCLLATRWRTETGGIACDKGFSLPGEHIPVTISNAGGGSTLFGTVIGNSSVSLT